LPTAPDDVTIVVMTGDEMRPTALPKLTYEDFLSFPDDGRRHELIDGDHYVTPSPLVRHQRVSGALFSALRAHCSATGAGEVFHAPLDVLLSSHDIVEPDLLVVLADQRDILTEEHVRGAPAIVIEILSPGTRSRDETLKRRLYARTGVREYWMVDPYRRAIAVCRQTAPGELERAIELTAAAGDVLASPLLPGFSVPLAVVFEPGAIDGKRP
jgi:Uma2 family endonuclease